MPARYESAACVSALLPDHDETQACTFEMNSLFGQKQDESLFDLHVGATDNHVFRHEGRTDGQGASGGDDPLGGD